MSETACHVCGVILAGGVGRRFGGCRKPLLTVGGKSMLAHIVDRLRPQVAMLAVSVHGAAERDVYRGALGPSMPLSVLVDPPAPTPLREGPLGGMFAALSWAHDQRAAWLAVVPGDSPFIPCDTVSRLRHAAEGTSVPAAHARSLKRDHPVVAILSVSALDSLKSAMLSGERQVGRWLRAIGAVGVEWRVQDAQVDPFFNVNTPQDLVRARNFISVP